MFVFEDAHWGDASSLELMEKVIAATETETLLVVITFRPEFKSPWSGYSHVSSLSLTKISRASIRQVIDSIVKGKQLPDEVVDQIVQKTDGIPLFIEELTRMVIESGLLEEQKDCYVLQGALQQLDIPSTLQASLLARLDRLNSARQIAQTAAAIGRQFDQQLLLHVMQITPVLLQQALQQLIEAELIFPSGSGEIPQYIFKHALIQDAAYESLLKTERQSIHHRIADALDQEFPLIVENRPEILAHHVTCASQIERALPLWLKAAKASLIKFSHVESRNQLDTGLSLLLENPQVPDFDIWELRYQAMLGQVWWVVRGYASPEAGKAYARARELCRTVSLPELVAPVLTGLWMFLIVGGQHRQAAMVSDELVARTTEQSDKNTHAATNYTVAMSQFAMGAPQTGKERLLRCIDAASHDPEDRTLVHEYGGDLRLTAKCYLTWMYLSLGEFDLAEEEVQRAFSFSEKLKVPLFTARADWIVSMYYTMKGDWTNAGIIAKRSLDVSNSLSSTMTQGAAAMIYYASQAITKDDVSHIEKMTEGLALYESTGARFFTIQKMCHCAEVMLHFNLTEQALEVLRKAKGRIAELGERYIEAEIHRFLGLATEKISNASVQVAEKHYLRAIEVAKQQNTILFTLRATNDLAQLKITHGDHEAAHQLLKPYEYCIDSGVGSAEQMRLKQLFNEIYL